MTSAGASVLDQLQERPPQPAALQVGRHHDPADVPLAVPRRAARGRLRRGGRTTARGRPSRSTPPALGVRRRATRCSAGMSTPSGWPPSPAASRRAAACRARRRRRGAGRTSRSASARRVGRRRQQVRPALGGAALGLLAAPRGDPRVVARQQHRRGRRGPARGRLGVDGVLQQPVRVRLLHQGLGVADERRAAAARRPRRWPAPRPHRRSGRSRRATPRAPCTRLRRARSRAGRCPRSDRRRRPGALLGQLVGERLRERLPAGRRHDEGGRPGRRTTVSSASPQGSGFMTMPAPPP